MTCEIWVYFLHGQKFVHMLGSNKAVSMLPRVSVLHITEDTFLTRKIYRKRCPNLVTHWWELSFHFEGKHTNRPLKNVSVVRSENLSQSQLLHMTYCCSKGLRLSRTEFGTPILCYRCHMWSSFVCAKSERGEILSKS